jgi:hypothetical protein
VDNSGAGGPGILYRTVYRSRTRCGGVTCGFAYPARKIDRIVDPPVSSRTAPELAGRRSAAGLAPSPSSGRIAEGGHHDVPAGQLAHQRLDIGGVADVIQDQQPPVMRLQPGQRPPGRIGTLRREVLDQLLIVSEDHLREMLTEYLQHYNTARPHRALGQLAPDQAHARPPHINLAEQWIRRKQVLSGLTSEYQIAA